MVIVLTIWCFGVRSSIEWLDQWLELAKFKYKTDEDHPSPCPFWPCTKFLINYKDKYRSFPDKYLLVVFTRPTANNMDSESLNHYPEEGKTFDSTIFADTTGTVNTYVYRWEPTKNLSFEKNDSYSKRNPTVSSRRKKKEIFLKFTLQLQTYYDLSRKRI